MATGLIEENMKADGRIEHEEAIVGVLAMVYLGLSPVSSSRKLTDI